MSRSLSEILKNARIKSGLKQSDVAEMVGVKGNTLSNWENARTEPDLKTLGKLCDIYKLEILSFLNQLYGEYNSSNSDINNLTISTEPDKSIISKFVKLSEPSKYKVEGVIDRYYEKEGNAPSDIKKMKVYETAAAAGLGNYMDYESEFEMKGYPAGEIPRRADFGIRIAGDSMEPDIANGSIVWVESTPEIEDDEIGIFVLNNDSLCKKLHLNHAKKQVVLVSINPKYKDIIVNEDDNLRTIGRVLPLSQGGKYQ